MCQCKEQIDCKFGMNWLYRRKEHIQLILPQILGYPKFSAGKAKK
jgi:hypothetical protein